jgi:hypothetical protein
MITEPPLIPLERRKGLYLKELEKRLDAMYQLSDKLATLASGALALTITFAHGTAPIHGCAFWFLRISWLGFIATVAGFVLIFCARIRLHKDLADKLKTEDGAFITSELPWYFKTGVRLLWGFGVGLLSLAIYGALTK